MRAIQKEKVTLLLCGRTSDVHICRQWHGVWRVACEIRRDGYNE